MLQQQSKEWCVGILLEPVLPLDIVVKAVSFNMAVCPVCPMVYFFTEN